MKVLVITYINDDHFENLCVDFLPSILRHNAHVQIVVMAFGLNPQNFNTLQQSGIDIAPFEASQFSSRIYWSFMADIAKQYPEVDLIMKSDSGDVFIQDQIFDDFPMSDGVGIIEEDHPADSGWSLGRIKHLPPTIKKYVLEPLAGKLMCNGGIVYGYRDHFIDFANNIQDSIDHTGVGHFFGLDQIFVNYHGRTKNYIHILPRTYNFVAQCQPYYIEDGIVYDADSKEKIKVVHNAGGRPIPRIYHGKNINKQHFYVYHHNYCLR